MNPPAQWLRREDAHDAIIDRPTWDEVQRLLALNRSHPAAARGKRRTYVFTGLLRCVTCERCLIGKGSDRRANSYVCSGYSQGAGCRGFSVNEVRLLGALATKLRDRFTPEFLDGCAEAIRRELAVVQGGGDDDVGELRRRVADLDAAVKLAITRMMRVPEELYRQAEQEALLLQQERDRAADALAKATSQQAPPIDVEALVAAGRASLGRLGEILATSDGKTVRAVLREHVDRIEIHFGEATPDDRSLFARAVVHLRDDSPLLCLADVSLVCQSVKSSAQKGHITISRPEYLAAPGKPRLGKR
jgi:hypothetical protein